MKLYATQKRESSDSFNVRVRDEDVKILHRGIRTYRVSAFLSYEPLTVYCDKIATTGQISLLYEGGFNQIKSYERRDCQVVANDTLFKTI